MISSRSSRGSPRRVGMAMSINTGYKRNSREEAEESSVGRCCSLRTASAVSII